jgi:group I intron endonuclease
MKKQDNAIIGIYKITNPKGETYIGQSVNIENRKKYYVSTKGKGQPKIYNSIKTYGWEFHTHELIQECLLNELDELEKYFKTKFIEEYGWGKALFCKLQDGKGGYDSEETKIKKSQAHKGKPKSETHKTNMKKPKNHGEKLSLREYTWNKKLREGIIKTKSTPVLQYDLKGNFIKEWSTIAEPLKLGFGDVDAALRGKQKTAGGYIWKFKN